MASPPEEGGREGALRKNSNSGRRVAGLLGRERVGNYILKNEKAIGSLITCKTPTE